ncbi:hypothetical protein SDRG_15643 [Saprolegnia diclina VS20]|uniref:Uncharacterized protein n=1 Tax=Saprolegnia diclina (strain VS20) TaxID=1156394 RepID=T0PWG0_SAPDV|nr:hypothetical protein SDRG_15643 [Saprolegnia diclina VS20]EQC26551.1 hypothetical protein SDRG_15643 [Saprolegnia diclina VS20]|eukprot:XP_008620044.1 hypothetical protein SDRG_15643 [Saprolegnia diclina VS20]
MATSDRTSFTNLAEVGDKINERSMTPAKSTDRHMLKKKGPSNTRRLLPLDLSAFDVPNSKSKRIFQRKDLVEAVRRVNSPIVLPSRFESTSSLGSSSSLGSVHGDGPESSSDSNKDVATLEDGVNLNARKYNERKRVADAKEKELSTLVDQYRAMQIETDELDRIQNQESHGAKEIQRLNTEIEECMLSMEEKMHTRRQLEHMIRRLQTNQIKFDSHIQAMSVAVEASAREAEEVRILSRQLEAGKSRTIQLLQDLQQQVVIERKQRTRELSEHSIKAKNAERMEQWRLKRMKQRSELAAELRGDLSYDEERRLLRDIENRRKANADLGAANMEISQRATDHDQVVDQMKQVTGASSLQDVVDKFAAQSLSNQSLEKEKVRAEARLSNAKFAKENALKALNDLKASGIGGIELNRDVYTALENDILQAKGLLKTNKAAYDCLDGVLAAVRQGASSLVQRLAPFDELLEINDDALVTLNGKDTGHDLLSIAEIKFAKVVELVGQQNGAGGGFTGYGGDGDDGFDDHGGRHDHGDEAKHLIWSPHGNSDPVVHRNNIRVKAKTGGHPDSARSDASSSSGVGDDEPVVANGPILDVLVPSRDILKMSSNRHFSEVMRKKELAEKRKNATERGISDEELTSKLKKKNQNEADKRLSTNPLLRMGLPPGVSQKDDALTKSNAFITQMPQLL